MEQAVFVDSAATGGGYVTDIVALTENGAVNRTIDLVSGSGALTWRLVSVSSTDINYDGIIDVPVAADAQQSSETQQNKLNWCDFKQDGSCDVVELDYSLINKEPETNGILDYCQQQGIAVLVRGPLAQGILSGRYTRESVFTDTIRSAWNPGGAGGEAYLEKMDRLDKVVAVAGSYGIRVGIQGDCVVAVICSYAVTVTAYSYSIIAGAQIYICIIITCYI